MFLIAGFPKETKGCVITFLLKRKDGWKNEKQQDCLKACQEYF